MWDLFSQINLYQNIFCYSPLKLCSGYTLFCTHTESKLEINNLFWNGHRHGIRSTNMHTFALADMHEFDSNLACNTHSLHPSCYRHATPVMCWQRRHQSWHCHSHRWWPQHPPWDLTAPALLHVHHQCLCQHPGSAFCVVRKCLRTLFCVVPVSVTEVIHFRALLSRKCTPFTSVSSDTTLTKPVKCVCIVSKPKTHLVCMYRTKYSRCRLSSSQVSNNKTKTLAKMSHVSSRHTERGLNANGEKAVLSL